MQPLVTLLAGLLLLQALPGSAAAPADSSCMALGPPGRWLSPGPAGPQALSAAALLASVAQRPVVLLGESHNSAEDHRWQLHTLAQLHLLAQQQDPPRPLAIGLEMFPRRVQPVLDAWVAGTLSEAEFLRRSQWEEVWGFDPRDYLPLFHYARMHRLPMLAMNVDRSVVRAIGQRGFDALTESEREQVGRPAAATPAYRARLQALMARHPQGENRAGNTPGGPDGSTGPGPHGSPADREQRFEWFVQAQTFWDRAMAEVLADHLRRRPDVLLVGILGSGHVSHGDGVAHQLAALGVAGSAALLTWPHNGDCRPLVAGLADALMLLESPPVDAPRLGIAMEVQSDGLRLTAVTPGSVAQAAGLQVDDLIVEAAGRPVASAERLRSLVQRLVPGSWLPLRVRRGDARVELVARLPAD